MTKVWFTSDTHFFHKNILRFCPNTRMGKNVDEMNEMMVQRHNSQVGVDDVVYHLGDVSFGTGPQTVELLRRLNGHIHLVLGNHDQIVTRDASVKSCFETVRQYSQVTIDGIRVVMFHFPIAEWDRKFHGAFHLYGHVHDKPAGITGRCKNVGIDTRTDMGLWSWDEIRAELEQITVVDPVDSLPTRGLT